VKEVAMTVQQFATRIDQLTDAKEWHEANPPAPPTDIQIERSFSLSDRIGLWVTDHVGTMGFFLLIAVWTLVWLGWNTFGPVELRFDPGPAFVLWLFISNLIQIHLMPLIMVGQNLQDRYAEIRAQADYEINQRAEREIETVLAHLSAQNDLLLEVLRRVERIESGPRSAPAG
jgi:uncharacterized membrane protein